MLDAHKDAVLCLNFSRHFTLLPSRTPASPVRGEAEEGEGGGASCVCDDAGNANTYSYMAVSASADKTLALWKLDVAVYEARVGEGLVSEGRASSCDSGTQACGDPQRPRGVLAAVLSAGDNTEAEKKIDKVVVTAGRVATLGGHKLAVYSGVLSACGQLVVSGSADGTVKVWSTKTCLAVRSLSGHKDAVMGVDVSHDSSLLLSASQDNTLRIWAANTGKVLKVLNMVLS